MPTMKTGKLEISYEQGGPAGGPALLLLHGWPDDATTWNEVYPSLNDAGFRTIMPMARGFGATR
jgi:pimeloyl-ACP methyl ester carboxylesterase